MDNIKEKTEIEILSERFDYLKDVIKSNENTMKDIMMGYKTILDRDENIIQWIKEVNSRVNELAENVAAIQFVMNQTKLCTKEDFAEIIQHMREMKQ